MALILKLASRNLLQDRLRFIGTVVGIVFSIVLVTIQLGLFLSFERMVSAMIDHASADLWVVPHGTKCFEDPSLLNAADRAKILAVPGVAQAEPLIIGFTQWSVPDDGTTPVFVIGSDGNASNDAVSNAPGLRPWNIIDGDLASLTQPDSVAVDQTYFSRLGVTKLGDATEIREQKVKVAAITNGIRSFTTTPYIFTTLPRARSYVSVPPNRVSYFLLRLAPGANINDVRQQVLAKVSGVEVLTPAMFSSRSRNFWLFGTGAGAALFAGALLGAIVGAVIVAQTLYSSTKDHLGEFATLRAIGSSNGYINKVIICQALLSSVVGFSVAASIGLIVVEATANTALPIVMTPTLTAILFGLTVTMCVISAIAAIMQVLRIDPAVAFRQ
jgi:putative ABC transport system permease protein